MNRGGPLGKYSQAVAALLATFLVVAAVGVRIAAAVSPEVAFTPGGLLDSAAWVAIGAVFGAAAATSVNGASVEAAHRRLDLIHAPASMAAEEAAIADVEAHPSPEV